MTITTIWALIGGLTGFITATLARKVAGTPVGDVFKAVLLTAALLILFAWRWGFSPELFVASGTAAGAAAITFVDLRTQRLPNRLVATAYLTITVAIVAASVDSPDIVQLLRPVAGSAVFLAFYGTFYTLFADQLGGGDVKLSVPLGAALAWYGWPALFTGLLLIWTLNAIAHVLVRLVRPKNQFTSIAHGPFLMAGSLLTIFFAGSG